jgi:hypothetical protein
VKWGAKLHRRHVFYNTLLVQRMWTHPRIFSTVRSALAFSGSRAYPKRVQGQVVDKLRLRMEVQQIRVASLQGDIEVSRQDLERVQEEKCAADPTWSAQHAVQLDEHSR